MADRVRCQLACVSVANEVAFTVALPLPYSCLTVALYQLQNLLHLMEFKSLFTYSQLKAKANAAILPCVCVFVCWCGWVGGCKCICIFVSANDNVI